MFTVASGDRADVQNVCIFITDGVSNQNSLSTIPVSRQLKDAGIAVVAIGIRLNDIREVTALASTPEEKFLFLLDDFHHLPDVKNRLVQLVCGGKQSEIIS